MVYEASSCGACYSPKFLKALENHRVDFKMTHIEYCRSGLKYEAYYIIEILSTRSEFFPFLIRKSFSSFRVLSDSIRKEVERKSLKKLKIHEELSQISFNDGKHLKMTSHFVKQLSHKREPIIEAALRIIMDNIPNDKNRTVKSLSKLIETFFLTDNVEESSKEKNLHHSIRSSLRNSMESLAHVAFSNSIGFLGGSRHSDLLTGSSTKQNSLLRNLSDPFFMTRENLLEDPNSASKKSSNIFSFIFVSSLFLIYYRISQKKITINLDILIFSMIAFFSLGKNVAFFLFPINESPHPDLESTNCEEPHSSQVSFLKKSVSTRTSHRSFRLNIEEEDETEEMLSPLTLISDQEEGRKHCISVPDASVFKIRGDNYFIDKKKISSGEYLFPFRGADLFLTDACPENIGSNSKIMGNCLREVPTFIINFRLPWGLFIYYSEIPERFLPFVRKANSSGEDSNSALPDISKMTPGDRTVCRYFLGDDNYRNTTLKIVPIIVQGPSIVKYVVGGKPSIIGSKLPITYYYEPSNEKLGIKEYYEVDLDITSSAAARHILHVVRSHTNSLTINLGFVLQANLEDELPEQMLLASKIHGLDPQLACSLPSMDLNEIFAQALSDDGQNSE